jgi:Recombination endonuclease VII
MRTVKQNDAEKKLKAWGKRLMDNYKLTPEKWQAIYNYQGGVCCICGRPERRPNQKLAVDHDHKTGYIRCLACSQCNPLLGKIERSFERLGMHKEGLNLPEILRKIAAVLDNPQAFRALGSPHYGYPGRTGTKKHRKMLKKLRYKERVNKPPVSEAK